MKTAVSDLSQLYLGNGDESVVADNKQLAESILEAARSFADASRRMTIADGATQESTLALKEADVATHDAHNDALEAHLQEVQISGDGHQMGFTSVPVPNLSENTSEAQLNVKRSQLAYERAETAAKMAEVSAQRAHRELEQAEANLLDMARSIPAVDGLRVSIPELLE